MSRTRVIGAEWLATAAGPAGYPVEGPDEVAFLGRSNVGKSSLLNRLVQRKKLARTSGTPGKTRLLHFFTVRRSSGEIVLVDLPGYGYAKVARSERKSWQRLIEHYLEQRDTLRVAVLLQDLRRDPSEDETLLLEWLAERGRPAVVAVTKIDKLKPGRRAAALRALKEALPLPKDRIIATSAQTGEGIDTLWATLDRLRADPDA